MSFTTVHQLIQTLSRGEKKRFSNYAKNSVVSNLYEQLNRIKRLDEQHLVKLRKKFKKDDPDYLITLILKSMRNHESGNVDNQIKALILDAKFLLRKGFYRSCYQRLQKAKQKAIAIYNHFDVLEVNAILIELYHLIRGDSFFIDKINLDAVLVENATEIQRLNEFLEQKNIHHQLLSLIRKGFPIKKKEEKDKLSSKFYAKLQQRNFDSGIAKYHSIQAKHLYHLLNAENKEALRYNQAALIWWEHPENEIYHKENRYRYIQTLINILNENILLLVQSTTEQDTTNLSLNLKQNSYEILEKIKLTLKSCTNIEQSKVLPAYYKGCLNVYSVTQSDDNFRETIEALESKFQIRKQFKLTDQVILLTQYAGFYFREYRFLSCKRWIEEFNTTAEKLPQLPIKLKVALKVLGVFASFAIMEKRNPSAREKLLTTRQVKQEVMQAIPIIADAKGQIGSFYLELLNRLDEILKIGKNTKDGVFRKRHLLKELAALLSKKPNEYFSQEINKWLLNRLNN